jgi:hypothetical protein
MNPRKILGLVAIVALAKMAFANHHHRMGPRGRGEWQERVAELHRELHRRDAEAAQETAATAAPSPAAATAPAEA